MTPEKRARILRTAEACWLAGIPLEEMTSVRIGMAPPRSPEHEQLVGEIRRIYLRRDGQMLLWGQDPWGGLVARSREDYRTRELPTTRRGEGA